MALVTKHVLNTCPRSAILVIHFIAGGTAVLVAKLGTRRRASMYRGEWAYNKCSEAFKDNAMLQIHSKSFCLKEILIVLNTFICKILKCKASFISKFKIACVAMCTLVMNCYSRDLLMLKQN